MQAYILINTQKGKEQTIYDAVLKMDEVSGAHIIFGEWDLIVKVKLESPELLGTFILDNIRPLPGVNISSTLIVAK
ncbi:MAG: Lrp/AsnC ligand binding domain-containing protein [Candidatus Nanoarchaeia archaeon]